MMQYKHHISIHRKFDVSKINKCWYQRKWISQSSNYGSYFSPKMYRFDSYLDNNENNFEIFDINNNNEMEPGCMFDENLVNFDQLDEIEKLMTISKRLSLLRLYH